MSKRHIKGTLRGALKRAEGIRATGISKFNVPQVLDIIQEYVQIAREVMVKEDESGRVASNLNTP